MSAHELTSEALDSLNTTYADAMTTYERVHLARLSMAAWRADLFLSSSHRTMLASESAEPTPGSPSPWEHPRSLYARPTTNEPANFQVTATSTVVRWDYGRAPVEAA